VQRSTKFEFVINFKTHDSRQSFHIEEVLPAAAYNLYTKPSHYEAAKKI